MSKEKQKSSPKMSQSRNKIAFYLHTISPIGGIETWAYYVLSELKDYHDVTLFYEYSDPAQLQRLVDAGVNCVKFTNTPKETFDILFKGYNGSPAINAKYYVHTIHACFSELPEYKFQAFDRTTHYMAVSQRAKDSFLELYPDTKQPIDVVPNFVPKFDIPAVKHFDGKIRFVVASRMSSEKGIHYVKDLLDKLDDMRIEYQLDLFCPFPSMPGFTNGKVKFLKPRLNIDFSEYHYLVQLSDSESYCYSVHEALSMGTAVIVKDLPVFRGIVKHGHNGYIYPNIDNISDIPVRFEYKTTGSIDNWLQYIKSIVK